MDFEVKPIYKRAEKAKALEKHEREVLRSIKKAHAKTAEQIQYQHHAAKQLAQECEFRHRESVQHGDEFLRDFLRCHFEQYLDHIRIISGQTLEEVKMIGNEKDQKLGVRQCRRLFNAPVLSDQIGYLLWCELRQGKALDHSHERQTEVMTERGGISMEDARVGHANELRHGQNEYSSSANYRRTKTWAGTRHSIVFSRPEGEAPVSASAPVSPISSIPETEPPKEISQKMDMKKRKPAGACLQPEADLPGPPDRAIGTSRGQGCRQYHSRKIRQEPSQLNLRVHIPVRDGFSTTSKRSRIPVPAKTWPFLAMKFLPSLQLLAAAAAPVSAAFTWQNVKIGGGGGFVPGIVFHPTAKGVAYARTDIGGLYRLNADDDSWTAVTDGITDDANWHNWGVDALALDPQDENAVYAAVGMYTNDWDPNNGSIIKSTDKGATWSTTALPFKVGGNMPGRGTGERLAVDPANSEILYFGARSGNGLWKSTDAGATFAKVSSFTAVGTYIADPTDVGGYNGDIQGLTFVTFDSTSGTTDGATSRIFVGTASNDTSSVYVSEDAGATWAAVADQPGTFFPHKAVLQPAEKALYLTYSDGTGPYDGTLGAVYRYDISNSTWTNITPVSGSDLYFGFGGIGVDMLVPGTIVVASLNSWWPDAQIFRSTDSGATWSKIWEWSSYPDMNLYYSESTPKAPWITTGFLDTDTKDLGWMIECLVIDPLDSDHWLYGTGLTMFGGHDLTNWDTIHNITIQSLADGIEEFAVLDLASPPGGSELLAAVGDDSGFTFASASFLRTSPNTPWMNPIFTSTTSVDYAGASVQNVIRIGNSAGTQQVAVSADGGATWNAYSGADTTMASGTVAYSADADTVLWSTGTSGVQRSQYQATFSAVASLPSGAVVASDKQNNTVFYAGSGSSFYVSTDTGATFATAGSLGSATAIRDIVSNPLSSAQIFVSTDVGVFHSTDYGASFTLTSTTLTNTYQIALGLGSGSTWNLYAFGIGAAGARLYGSADNGASWTDIQGDAQGFGSISGAILEGSGNTAGQVWEQRWEYLVDYAGDVDDDVAGDICVFDRCPDDHCLANHCADDRCADDNNVG
ncbi:Uu.00g123200.m01.CDS01 [Anthostomella pinea]|uniref:Uu.00g123200.m01.CDS01 n=1 Tax=Anthostomella pinea TaxID=933095 RepID=A0AAI8VHW1_9PEZI|nr:Uu.00g123200.m01.CDS01 [Anthostomella pinea]